MIVAQGGLTHGYSLFVEEGKPAFATRHKGQMTVLRGDQSLPGGRCTLRAALTAGGKATLEVDGRQVAEAEVPGPVATPADGLTVGQDGGDPVGPYNGPRTFRGGIEGVTIRLGEFQGDDANFSNGI